MNRTPESYSPEINNLLSRRSLLQTASCGFGYMALMGMYTARRNQSHEVRRAAGTLQRCYKIPQRRDVGYYIFGDGLIDPRKILQHWAPSAQIHVPYFGITHLSCW